MTVAQAAPHGGSVPELLRQVRRLEVVARQNVASWAPGESLTSILGRGLVFHEPRKYVPGEPARRIDWNITARVGEPYVRVHQEERRREIFLAVDVSPSMHVGFTRRTKLETAVELAATLAASAIDGGDRVGYVTFADRVLDEGRPRGGRSQLFRVLRALLGATAPWTREVPESDPRQAIHAVQRSRGRRLVVFLVSDFIDHDVPEDLKYVQARHDVSLLHVYDPLEYAASAPVVLRGRATEGRPVRRAVRLGEGESLAARTGFLRSQAARHGIATASFSTAEPVAQALGRLFHGKRRRRRSGPTTLR